MKAANFINILLAIAVVILAAELRKKNAQCPMRNGRCAMVAGEQTNNLETVSSAPVVIDSTGLVPGVKGFGGPVPVEVEVKDGRVARVAPKLPNDETPGFFKRLEEAGLWRIWDGMPVEVAATAHVDAVTGATYSSDAAIANVRAALAVALPQGAAEGRKSNIESHGDIRVAEVSSPLSSSDMALAALGVDASAITAVPPPKTVFREFDVHADFTDNPFTVFTGGGMLLCAGDRVKSNAMTIGWGGLGTLWGRNDAVTVYVAEKRYTKSFMDKATHFTVMAFDKKTQSRILAYMGHNSGRDGDKAAALGLHLAYTDNGTPYYEEAQMVLECEMMYSAQFDPAGMKDIPSKLYANFPAGIHFMYIGRIVKALRK
ncbi:MAG: FMN-binding protein [Kiritimatiellae bacterium]|nr:FMN-binding protein [Kiritimatiellia bacterium]